MPNSPRFNATWNLERYVRINCQTTNVATGSCVNTADGGHYRGTAQHVTLEVIHAGAVIRYTTDGSEPTGASPAYSSPIDVAALGATATIKAAAYADAAATSPLGVVTTAVYSQW